MAPGGLAELCASLLKEIVVVDLKDSIRWCSGV